MKLTTQGVFGRASATVAWRTTRRRISDITQTAKGVLTRDSDQLERPARKGFATVWRTYLSIGLLAVTALGHPYASAKEEKKQPPKTSAAVGVKKPNPAPVITPAKKPSTPAATQQKKPAPAPIIKPANTPFRKPGNAPPAATQQKKPAPAPIIQPANTPFRKPGNNAVNRPTGAPSDASDAKPEKPAKPQQPNSKPPKPTKPTKAPAADKAPAKTAQSTGGKNRGPKPAYKPEKNPSLHSAIKNKPVGTQRTNVIPSDETCVFSILSYKATLYMEPDDVASVVRGTVYSYHTADITATGLTLAAPYAPTYRFNGHPRNSLSLGATYWASMLDDNRLPQSRTLFSDLLTPNNRVMSCGIYGTDLTYDVSYQDTDTEETHSRFGNSVSHIRCPGNGDTSLEAFPGMDQEDNAEYFQDPIEALALPEDQQLIWRTDVDFTWNCTKLEKKKINLASSVTVDNSKIKRMRTEDYGTIGPGESATLSSCNTEISRSDGKSDGATASEGTVSFKVISPSTSDTLFVFGTSVMESPDMPFGYCLGTAMCETTSTGNCTSFKDTSWTNTTGSDVYLIADTKKTQGAKSSIKLNASFLVTPP